MYIPKLYREEDRERILEISNTKQFPRIDNPWRRKANCDSLACGSDRGRRWRIDYFGAHVPREPAVEDKIKGPTIIVSPFDSLFQPTSSNALCLSAKPFLHGFPFHQSYSPATFNTLSSKASPWMSDLTQSSHRAHRVFEFFLEVFSVNSVANSRLA